VFELLGGWGLNPPTCLLNPPNKMPWVTLDGVSFNPPAVVNDAESPVCNANDNEWADVNPPTYFLTIQTLPNNRCQFQSLFQTVELASSSSISKINTV
jgi:hypothetical protein